MQYFITPKNCIAVNSKVGTNSVCEAIVRRFYPERIDEADTENHGDLAFRSLVNQTDTPTMPVLILVRDPVERFISVLGMTRLSADEAIAGLQSGWKDHPQWQDHPLFEFQSDYLPATGPYKIFRFPEGVEAFCKEADLVYPLPVRNALRHPRPILSPSQREWVEDYYQEDISVFAEL